MKNNKIFEIAKTLDWKPKIILFGFMLTLISSGLSLAVPLLLKNGIDDFTEFGLERIDIVMIFIILLFTLASH